jgi:toxin ParE1/3/4
MSARKLPVILTDEARDDLRSIALYGLTTWGERQATRYHAEIEKVLASLSRFPRMGRRKDELPGDIRTIGVGHHRILDRVDADAITVLRVLHARMDETHYLDL